MLKKRIMIVLYIILGLVALLLIIPVFAKKTYVIQRSITINNSIEEVYHYMRFLKNQPSFNMWLMRDPNISKSFRGTDGAIGSVLAYSGNKQTGAGEQEIIGLWENKRIDIEVRFERPFKTVSTTPVDLQVVGINQTNVTWTMNGRMNYPMNLMLLIADFDSFLGKDLEASLQNLKRNVE